MNIYVFYNINQRFMDEQANKKTETLNQQQNKNNKDTIKTENKVQNSKNNTQKQQEVSQKDNQNKSEVHQIQKSQDNRTMIANQQRAQSKQQKKESISAIEQQLLDMGFEKYLVKQALKITNDKDKAIQYIITTLQKQQKMQEKILKKQQKQKKVKIQGKGQQQDDDDFQDEQQECKMVFLVRMDLKMGLGKIAAQVAHATLKAYKQMESRVDKNQIDEVNFFEWMEGGQKKIVVKVDDESQLLATLKKANEMKINHCYIRDAGLTQIASGSITVGAIGPAPSSEVDSITKHFKLL